MNNPTPIPAPTIPDLLTAKRIVATESLEFDGATMAVRIREYAFGAQIAVECKDLSQPEKHHIEFMVSNGLAPGNSTATFGIMCGRDTVEVEIRRPYDRPGVALVIHADGSIECEIQPSGQMFQLSPDGKLNQKKIHTRD